MSAPAGVERDYPLSRLTTVRAGGSAAYFARPSSDQEVVELLAWAEKDGLPVGVVGSGSNLLVSDEGFEGLVMKLGKELTAIERHGTEVVCGGGARLPSAAARAADWGLAGLEFGVNIPGTVGGAVRMNGRRDGEPPSRGPGAALPRLGPRGQGGDHGRDVRPLGVESGRREGHHGWDAAKA